MMGVGGRCEIGANNLDGDGRAHIYSCTLQLKQIIIDKRKQTCT